MIELDYSFEKSPWEAFLETKKPGETVSAARLLTFLENEDEEGAEEAFAYLDSHGLILDISHLPRAAGTGEAAARLRQEVQLVQNGLTPQSLGENDPLRLYLEEVEEFPPDADAEPILAACIAGEEAARQTLVQAGIRRVVELAREYVGNGVLLLDLIQEGSLGLWQGIREFQGGSYDTWRDRWVRNAMARAILLQARSSGISQKMREAMEDYRQTDQRLLTDLGRNATLAEIADQMHMTLEETETVKKTIEDAQLLQKSAPPQEEPQEAEQDQAVEDTAYFQMRQRIMELLSTLSPEDAELLTLRFGLEKGAPLSPEETGAKLGMTAQEVVEREANALAMLRSQN